MQGVVTTHAGLEAQVSNLHQAWSWQPDDVIYNVLPLHHVHGVVNVVNCALYAGATCEMAPSFDAAKTASGVLMLVCTTRARCSGTGLSLRD